MEPSSSPRGRAVNTPLSSARPWRRGVAAGLPTLFFVGALGLVVTAPAASAGATALYAYAAGGAASPTSCPQTAATSQQCTLAAALSLAKAGGTVALATPGKTGHYVGNWLVSTSGTSSSAPLTIKPAPAVTGPVLDGNHGKPAGCQTKACDGPVLTIGSGVHVDIYGLTVQNADNTLDGVGGAIQNYDGGTLIVSACTFTRDTANAGGAIDNADGGTGTVTVSGSTFSGNSAGEDGGAIDNADNNGTGTLTVSASTFTANTVRPSQQSEGGGAIDSGDNNGTGTLAVSASTFSANSARYGGAVATGTGTGTVSASTFSGNTADYGAAICSGCSGTGTFAVSGSTFSANRANEDGGAIMNGWTPNSGTLIVSASTFSANSAAGNPNSPGVDSAIMKGYGGGIDNDQTGTLSVSASTFSTNTAKNGGGSINNFRSVWAAADIFNGGCHEGTGATWKDEGYNVGADATCQKAGTGDASHGAGHLGTLAHNGGPTETMLALAANPALGVVPLNTTVKLNGRPVTLCPTTDQRGVHSTAGKACNAGAVQSPAP